MEEKPKISTLPSAAKNQTIDCLSLIGGIGKGDFKADVDHELTRVIAAMMEILKNENRDCNGEIAIKMKFTTKSGAIVPNCSVVAKLPASKPVTGIVYGDEDGNLFARDPNQSEFSFR
jgi:hypothetical protein